MKTVKKKDLIKRVSDAIAVEMTTNQGWIYVPKSEWKNEVRNVKNEKVEKVEIAVDKAPEKNKKIRTKNKNKK
jgi:hypothetical protein